MARAGPCTMQRSSECATCLGSRHTETARTLRWNALTKSMSPALLHSCPAFFNEGSPALSFLLSQQVWREKQQSHEAKQPGLSSHTPAQSPCACSPHCTLIRWCVLHVRISAPRYIEWLFLPRRIRAKHCHLSIADSFTLCVRR